MQRVEQCAYQAVPDPILVLAAHILGFPSCVLSGGVGWSTRPSGPATPTNGTQLEGPGLSNQCMVEPDTRWQLRVLSSSTSSFGANTKALGGRVW